MTSMAFMMRFYNNAAKIFGILVVLCRRFVNIAIGRHLKQEEGVDYQRLPLVYFFVIFFLRAEDCAENCRKNRLAQSGSCSHSMRKDRH